MECLIAYVPSNDIRLICREIELQLLKLQFNPNLMFIFTVENIGRYWKQISKVIRRSYPEIKIIGCTISGYFVDGKVWNKGAIVVFARIDSKFKVVSANESSITETIKRFKEKTPKGYNAGFLMFASLRLDSKIEAFKFFLKDKALYGKYSREKTKDGKANVLKEFWKYLDEKKILCPMDKVMKEIGKFADIPILGFRMIGRSTPLELPIIFQDENDISKGLVGIFFKDANVSFSEAFPERGNSYEETLKILRENETCLIYPERKVIVEGYGPLLAKIDNMRYSDFVSKELRISKDYKIEETLKKMEKKEFKITESKALMLISKETYGVYSVGLVPTHLLSFYPSLISMDIFFEEAWVGREKEITPETITHIVNDVKLEDSLKIFLIDGSIESMYRANVIYRAAEKFNLKNSIALLTSPPCAYLPKPKRRYMCEVADNICCSLVGTYGLLEIF